MSEPKLETKTKNINNQRLFEEIDEFMIQVFATIDTIVWTNKQHREEFTFLIDDWMENFALDSGKIIQFEVFCDGRNNSLTDIENGIVHFTIRYRQKNCLNTSEIDYIITSN